MSRTKKDRHDDADTYEEADNSFEEDEFTPSVYKLERRVYHTLASEIYRPKKRTKCRLQSGKQKRRVEKWDDDWVDPEDDLIYGFTGGDRVGR